MTPTRIREIFETRGYNDAMRAAKVSGERYLVLEVMITSFQKTGVAQPKQAITYRMVNGRRKTVTSTIEGLQASALAELKAEIARRAARQERRVPAPVVTFAKKLSDAEVAARRRALLQASGMQLAA